MQRWKDQGSWGIAKDGSWGVAEDGSWGIAKDGSSRDKEVKTWAGRVFAFLSAGADTKANTLGAAAHMRLSIFVSLRTAASLEAPSAPIWLERRLQRRGAARMVRNQECQRALT